MSTEARFAGPAAGITLLVLLLVLGAVLVANLASFAVTFNGPPPRPAPVQVEEIATLLAGGSDPRVDQRVRIVDGKTPLAPRIGERPRPEIDARLAAALGVSPAHIIGRYGRGGPPRMSERAIFGGMTVALRTPTGWRSAQTRPEPLVTPWHRTTLLAMLATLLLLAGPGWALARAINRPLARLADAADAAGTGGPTPAMPSGGPREVRRLARAFDAMRERLSRAYEARATMLAAIAHDLGTPLTRIAFWIDRLPDAERIRATADLAEMREMIGSVLSFARDGSAGRRVRLDLGSLLDSLIEDMARVGRLVTIPEHGPRVVVLGDPGALRRLFANLIENALRYAGEAEVAWTAQGDWAEIWVQDRGPGVDPALLPVVFDPFVRGEPSRNRETGGSGLGLSIVRAIAEAHGGTVALANRDGGGAIATVRLPLAG